MLVSNELPEGVTYPELLDCLRRLSWGAADILRAYARGEKPPFGFQEALTFEDESDGPVSAADLAVNSWLLDGLKSNFPSIDWQLLSEETVKISKIDSSTTAFKEWIWILDPLDGTKDFLQGTGEYAVHLALIKGNSPKLGVVLLPEKEELWFGVVGSGAWCENRKGLRSNHSFSDRRNINELILVSSRNHREKRLEELIERLSLGGAKAVGSVGCKIAAILKGEADMYISLSGKSAPKDWDMAAPEAVLKAAGGFFTHANGIALTYNDGTFLQEGCLLASHGYSHDLLCRAIEKEMNFIDPIYTL